MHFTAFRTNYSLWYWWQGVQEWSYVTAWLRHPQPSGSRTWPRSTVWLIVNCGWSSTLRRLHATVSITCTGYDKLDALLAKKSHHSWSQCLFYPDLITVIHCWPVYHLLLSNLYKEFRTHLFIWYLLNLGLRDHETLVLQQLHWLPVEHRITFKLCMLMHRIHIGCAPRYMADSVQSIVEFSRRPGLRSADTADYVKHCLQSKFSEHCFSYAGPAAWNSLPHSIKLITDTKLSRFKQLLKSHLFCIAFWHFVSAPEQFVSRALQVRICICTCPSPLSLELHGCMPY